MPFIWRHKTHALPNAPSPEAATCLEAAYILMELAGGSVSLSANIISLFGIPATSLEALAEALKPESRPALKQALQALKQGQILAPLQIQTQEGKFLSCRASIVPSEKGDARRGVLWFMMSLLKRGASID